MLISLIRLLIRGISYAVDQEVKNQPAPELSPALYKRQSRTILEYIDVAANMMIAEGKKASEIKAILINKGLHEDHLDVVIEKAERKYKDWFNETGGKTSVMEQYEQSFAEQARAVVNTVVIPHEDHSLHYCTLIDFKRYYQLSGRKILYAAANKALLNAAVMENGDIAIKQATFSPQNDDSTNPFLRIVTINGQRDAIYPYLKTNTTISFYSRQIAEWDNGAPIIEAEIEGEWNKSVPIGFFATDYAVKKNIYKTQANINVKLSAFAFELVESDRNNNEFSQQPKGFWLNKAYKHPSYFSFEGLILEIKTAAVDQLSIGCVMTLKLVSGSSPGTELVVETYISNNNINANRIQKGMLVSGNLWFQGEIAE